MATLQTLRQRLAQDASISASEGLSHSQLERILSVAITQHNPAYTASTLPASEEEAVLLLAWAGVCYRRASAFAQERNAKGSNGFDHESNTPYQKNINLAKELTARYSSLVSALGLSRSANAIVVSSALISDPENGGLAPYYNAPSPVASVALTVTPESSPTTSAIVAWSVVSPDLNTYDALLFTKEGSDPIYQVWNAESDSGVPRVANGTTLLTSVSNMAVSSLKVEGLDRTVVNRFLLVIRSRSLKYAYSNEVVVAASS